MNRFRVFIASLLVMVSAVLIGMLASSPAFAAVDPNVDFFTQVMQFVSGYGGLPWAAKISGLVLLLIASMKVSFLQPLWSKLGYAQVFVAPLLGVVVGVISMPQVTLAGLFAYLGAGVGAVALHEILDGVKGIPGLGSSYVSFIGWVEGILGAPKTPPSA